MAAECGDVARFPMAFREVVLVNRPDVIRSLLVTNADAFAKGPGLARARTLLGDGILTSEPPRHGADRRRLAPAFSRAAVADHVPEMVRAIDQTLCGWTDRLTIDLGAEMSRLTLAVASRCLFGIDLSARSAEISTAIGDALAAQFSALSAGGFHPAPHRRAELMDRALRTLRPIVCEALAGGACPHKEALTDPSPAADAADPPRVGKGCDSLLPASASATGASVIGEALNALTDDAAVEQAQTILLAAHESLSVALTWTLAILARRQEDAARIRNEAAERGGELDPARLPFTHAVLAESMRLYPPAWLLTREATREVSLSDEVTIEPGAIVLAAPCVTHVDRRYWNRPDDFLPERWMEGPRPATGAYFPFGMGPRNCIGEQFAWTEGVLALSAICRRWTVQIGEVPDWQPLVNLRPKRPVSAQVRS